jgi:hypothetical protein
MGNLPIVTGHFFIEFAMASALCALACALVLCRWLKLRHAAHTGRWPAVDGVVLDSAVVAERGEGRQVFRPMVRYRYEVEGQRFEGGRIEWAVPQASRKYTRARRMLDAYRAGRRVKVHYDPQRPGVAVLQPARAINVPPLMVIAPTAAIYVLFIAGPMLIGR